MKLDEKNLRRIVSLMGDAGQDLSFRDGTTIFLGDELNGAASDLLRAIPEILALVKVRDTLCRKHFEDTLFHRYWVNKIHRDPKTGWLVPGDIPQKNKLFERSYTEPEMYADETMQSAWEGYKLAFEEFEI